MAVATIVKSIGTGTRVQKTGTLNSALINATSIVGSGTAFLSDYSPALSDTRVIQSVTVSGQATRIVLTTACTFVRQGDLAFSVPARSVTDGAISVSADGLTLIHYGQTLPGTVVAGDTIILYKSVSKIIILSRAYDVVTVPSDTSLTIKNYGLLSAISNGTLHYAPGVQRNFTTITAWEAACPSAINASCVVDGTTYVDGIIWKGECYKDSIFVENIYISGTTSDATRYVHLTAAAGEGHTGIAGTGVVISANANTTNYVDLLISRQTNVKVSGLEFTNWNASHGIYFAYTSVMSDGGDWEFYDNIVHDEFAGTASNAFTTTTRGRCYRNILYETGTPTAVGAIRDYTFLYDSGETSGDVYYYNNTIYNFTTKGINSAGAWYDRCHSHIFNNIAFNCGTSCFSSDDVRYVNGGYNASSDTTAGSTSFSYGSTVSQTASNHFRNIANDGTTYDLRLKNASTLRGIGQNNSAMTSSKVGTFNLTNNSSLKISVNGGAYQTATFTTANFVNIAAATVGEVVVVLNASWTGVSSYVRDGVIWVIHSTQSTSSYFQIQDGNTPSNDKLRFSTKVITAFAYETGIQGNLSEDFGIRDIGADQYLAITKIRSIGTSSAYSTGTWSVDYTGTILTLTGGTLPARVGRGDAVAITNGTTETLYILEKVSSTVVKVQLPSANKQASGLTYSCDRVYSLPDTWEAACPADLPAVDTIWQGELYADQLWTTMLTIGGIVTDTNCYPRLWGALANRHRGVSGAGVVWDPTATGDVIIFNSNYIEVGYLEIKNIDGSGVNSYCFQVNANVCRVHHNLIHDASVGANNGAAHLLNNGHFLFYRNIVYNIGSIGINRVIRDDGDFTLSRSIVYNNTFYNTDTALLGSSQAYTRIVRNNLFLLSATADMATWNCAVGGVTNNGTTRSSMNQNSATNKLNLVVADNVVNVAGANFNLKSGSILIGAGITLGVVRGSYTNYNEDITGFVITTQAWDIGAFQYQASTKAFPFSLFLKVV